MAAGYPCDEGEDGAYLVSASSSPPCCEDPHGLAGLVLAVWDAHRFRWQGFLQEASGNQGRVELVEDLVTGKLVAVKAMPIAWTRMSHAEFVVAHPYEKELPWRDIEVTYHLSQIVRVDCVSEFIGLYQRASEETGEDEIRLALSYAGGGDLFCWLERSLSVQRLDRETASRGLMGHVFRAVQQVHQQGIAHGDLSLENVLLVSSENVQPEDVQVRLIDFGAATGVRAVGSRGKPSYQAPEGHTNCEYDARLADAFQTGVMLFTLLVGNYPWKATRPHLCPCFRFVMDKGLAPYLVRRKVKRPSGEIVSLADSLSPVAISLLDGLLQLQPAYRLSVENALAHPFFTGCTSSVA